jgi:hypothetical protein
MLICGYEMQSALLSVQGVICYRNQVEIPPIVKATPGIYRRSIFVSAQIHKYLTIISPPLNII